MCSCSRLGAERAEGQPGCPCRGPSPRKGWGGCRAAPWWPPRTHLCLCPAAMDGTGVGQDAMKNCTDQEYWDSLVQQCIPCSLACSQPQSRKCDAVCGECPWMEESGMGQSWEGGSDPRVNPRAGSEPAQLCRAKTPGRCDSFPWIGWGWQQLRSEARTKCLHLCTAPFWAHRAASTPVSPPGASPRSKGRAGSHQLQWMWIMINPQPGTGTECPENGWGGGEGTNELCTPTLCRFPSLSHGLRWLHPIPGFIQ